MDFSDLQVLSAGNDAELNQRTRTLLLIRTYTLAFFDKHLRGRKTTLLDRSTPDPLIEAIERFRPAKRRSDQD